MENENIITILNKADYKLTETSVLNDVLLQAEERILPAIEAIRSELLERAQAGEKLMNFDLKKGYETKKWTDEAKVIEIAKTIGCDVTTKKAKSVAEVKKEFGDLVIQELEKNGCIVHCFVKNTLKRRK
jgi:hypothetical protein